MKKPGMTNRRKQGTRGIAVFLGAALFCTSGVAVSAKGDSLEEVIQKTADYETGIVTDPTVASIGGEWTVIPLARGDASLPDDYFEKGKLTHELIMKFGKYFLSNPQKIEFESLDKVNEPAIYITNHGFKDDILASLLAAKERAFIVFGSLPQFYGTLDGVLSASNGVVMVNRKMDNSRKTSIDKAKYVLKNNMNLLICPEGVWNKTPNELMLNFWSGFYRIAKKEDGTFYPIIPIIHYINNTHKKGEDNPIHTVVDDPIILLKGTAEKEGIEYIRTRMLSWYWRLMERFGTDTRDNLIKENESFNDVWEDELTKRVNTVSKYDLQIETTADYQRKDTPLKVFEPIANLELTKNNSNEVLAARKLVRQLKRDDFQHRF